MIVGLDSLDDSANYVHIADVKGNIDYYCPCCKGLIKPRAYKKNKDYKVQSHFYHESGGCSEESFVHYICKIWLFEKGCKFKVNNTKYIVSSIETEKTLHTSFGDYRPDIIVNTESGKTFFFEIKYANKKTELYAPKWDELGNDVIEVDAREFINNKHDCSIPEFKLIYSNGECFIKSYSHIDYENTIAKRKLEWKRQDKLNYKIQWERLDWFWVEMQHYKQGIKTISNVFDTFSKLNLFDKEICFDLLKRQSCISGNNQKFRDIINKEVVDYWTTNASTLIGNKIKFDCCTMKPKNFIYICYHFTSIDGYRRIEYINISNKEWIIRPTKIQSIINRIIKKIEYTNAEIENTKTYNIIFEKVINKISSMFKFCGCIWFLDISNYSLKIGIKNGYTLYHTAILNVSYVQFSSFANENSIKRKNYEISFDNVYKFLMKNLEKKIRDIYNYVDKYDGINSEYRHMFVKRNEVN